MKQIFVILNILFATNFVFSQTIKGMALETTISSNNDSRNIKYERKIDDGFDKDDGKFFRTVYNFRNPDNTPVMTIAILNFKTLNRIEIYIYPYKNGVRLNNMLQYYTLTSDSFTGLNYIEQLEEPSLNNDGSTKLNISISYISTKKENLIIHQINSKLFNLHYRID
jgi:hypothetical protein